MVSHGNILETTYTLTTGEPSSADETDSAKSTTIWSTQYLEDGLSLHVLHKCVKLWLVHNKVSYFKDFSTFIFGTEIFPVNSVQLLGNSLTNLRAVKTSNLTSGTSMGKLQFIRSINFNFTLKMESI
jgi:hypothetical protein